MVANFSHAELHAQAVTPMLTWGSFNHCPLLVAAEQLHLMPCWKEPWLFIDLFISVFP